MIFVIGVLTAVMLMDCLVLVLLVLMQLPKKEAGAGLAFGGAATDALFGAGSGNFLTKATKYTAVIFFVFAVVLSVLQSRYAHQNSSEFQQQIEQQQSQPAALPESEIPPANSSSSQQQQRGAAPSAAAPGQTNLLMTMPPINSNNATGPETSNAASATAPKP